MLFKTYLYVPLTLAVGFFACPEETFAHRNKDKRIPISEVFWLFMSNLVKVIFQLGNSRLSVR